MKPVEALPVGGTMIREVDFSQISSSDIEEWLSYDAIMNAECPLTPFQLARPSLNSLPGHISVRLFVARDPDGAVAADGRIVMTRAAENNRACQIHVSVRPDRRGRGIAKALLNLIVEAAEDRTILVGWSTDRVAAGASFARRLGAERVQDFVVNSLLVSELNRQIVERWMAQGSAGAAEYSLKTIAGPYPEDLLAALVELRVVANSGHPALLHEVPVFTIEAMRAVEAASFGGPERLTLVALHQPTSTIAGFTEVFYTKLAARTMRQAGTAVHPLHRGRGLGKWLKAAMLEQVVTAYPDVEDIQTGNAASNEAILAINQALGFKPSMTATAWQVPTARAREATRSWGHDDRANKRRSINSNGAAPDSGTAPVKEKQDDAQ